MVKVKICGITSVAQAEMVVQAGADAIGLVFYDPSPRAIDIARAQAICAILPPFVTAVGLVVNPASDWLHALLDQVPIDLIQFHGDETEPFCKQFNKPYIKAIRVQQNMDLTSLSQTFNSSRGILLDTYVPGQPGGTGQSFDWDLIPKSMSKPLILAGGLNPDNVAQAVARVKPWAVDVSGGVEQSKGVKDQRLVNAFISGVRSDR